MRILATMPAHGKAVDGHFCIRAEMRKAQPVHVAVV